MSFKCPNCVKQYDTLQSLIRHWTRGHKEKSETLYQILNGLDGPQVCACGCGEETKFLDAGRGYSEYRWGHKAKVKGQNNFQKNGGFKKSLETRRKMFVEGELQIWNKGETKETHSSVAQYGKNGSKTIKGNPKELKRRSERLHKGRLNGTVRSLYGPEHSQWNGGTSTLRGLLIGSTKLYHAWKFPKLSAANFTCEECDAKNVSLHVHHDTTTMSEILKIVADNNKLSEMFNKPTSAVPKKVLAIKSKLIDEVTDYHVQNNVSGVVLCKDCHGKEHGNLNFK